MDMRAGWGLFHGQIPMLGHALAIQAIFGDQDFDFTGIGMVSQEFGEAGEAVTQMARSVGDRNDQGKGVCFGHR
jgi:hypothetical protein